LAALKAAGCTVSKRLSGEVDFNKLIPGSGLASQHENVARKYGDQREKAADGLKTLLVKVG